MLLCRAVQGKYVGSRLRKDKAVRSLGNMRESWVSPDEERTIKVTRKGKSKCKQKIGKVECI